MSNGNALPMKDNLVASSEPTPHHHIHAHGKPVSTTLRHDQTQPQQPATSLREVCQDIHDRVTRFLSTPSNDEITRGAQDQTRVALSVIEQALRDYTFDSLSLSYNGGKDCLVLLILYLAAIHTHFTQPSGRRKRPEEREEDSSGRPDTTPSESASYFPTTIPSIYAKPPDPFDAVTTFVDSSTQDYHLDLVHISTNPGPQPKSKPHSSGPQTTAARTNGEAADSNHTTTTTATSSSSSATDAKPIITFRDAFAMYLQDQPQIQAIFVGTRRTDPHGATLQHFQMTDGNWPRFMRIHPVIDWKLSEIWSFLRSEHLADPRTGRLLEYCSMYDAGYTSLGGVGDTLRNPKLMYIDESGQERYKPAYQMTADHAERAGRE